MIPALIVLGVIVVALVVALLMRRRQPDGVDSFRRQIDALSADARRPTVHRVRESEEADDDGA